MKGYHRPHEQEIHQHPNGSANMLPHQASSEGTRALSNLDMHNVYATQAFRENSVTTNFSRPNLTPNKPARSHETVPLRLDTHSMTPMYILQKNLPEACSRASGGYAPSNDNRPLAPGRVSEVFTLGNYNKPYRGPSTLSNQDQTIERKPDLHDGQDITLSPDIEYSDTADHCQPIPKVPDEQPVDKHITAWPAAFWERNPFPIPALPSLKTDRQPLESKKLLHTPDRSQYGTHTRAHNSYQKNLVPCPQCTKLFEPNDRESWCGQCNENEDRAHVSSYFRDMPEYSYFDTPVLDSPMRHSKYPVPQIGSTHDSNLGWRRQQNSLRAVASFPQPNPAEESNQIHIVTQFTPELEQQEEKYPSKLEPLKIHLAPEERNIADNQSSVDEIINRTEPHDFKLAVPAEVSMSHFNVYYSDDGSSAPSTIGFQDFMSPLRDNHRESLKSPVTPPNSNSDTPISALDVMNSKRMLIRDSRELYKNSRTKQEDEVVESTKSTNRVQVSATMRQIEDTLDIIYDMYMSMGDGKRFEEKARQQNKSVFEYDEGDEAFPSSEQVVMIYREGKINHRGEEESFQENERQRNMSVFEHEDDEALPSSSEQVVMMYGDGRIDRKTMLKMLVMYNQF